jgi:hypothetical protein
LRTLGFKSGSLGANAGEIQYAIRLKPDRVAEVRERGMVRTITTSAVAGDFTGTLRDCGATQRGEMTALPVDT